MSNWYFSFTNCRRRPPRVVELCLTSDALAGLRMAFVSDVHMRDAFAALAIDKLLDQIESLNPDIVLWGGDFAETREMQREFFDMAGRLRPRFGSFSVVGNNDIELTAPDKLREIQAGARVELLFNEARSVAALGGVLTIVGLDEPKYGAPDFSLLRTPRMPNETRVLMVHSPLALDLLPDDLENPPELILCGHTHGGQISPFGLSPYTFGYEHTRNLKNFYVTGTHRIGESVLIVSNGIGDSAIPLRVGAPPELHIVRFLSQNCASKS